jgi:acyl-CoA synthetase (AMP-forming)/AMP-acid ligase II
MHGTMQDFPLTLQHILWRIEKLFPKKEIITLRADGVHRYTYGDFAGRVKRLANVLAGLGIGAGDRVGTIAWNNYRHLELYYAAPCMGAVLHTLNPRLFPEQLAFIINDAADRVLFVDETLLPALDRIAGQIPTVETIVVLSDGGALPAHSLGELRDYETLLAAAAEDFHWPTLDEQSAAAMCYTSGTTGNPKGVVYTHRSQFLHAMTGLQTSGLSLSEADVVLPVVPMFHVNSWGLPFAAGMVGATQVFPDRWAGDGAVLLKVIADEAVTFLAGVPTVWLALLRQIEATGATLPSVRTVVCGGSAAPPAFTPGG